MEEINIMIGPHNDDIWLSCGNYILNNPRKRYVIISIASDLDDAFQMRVLMQNCPSIIRVVDLCYPNPEWKEKDEKQVLKTYQEFIDQSNKYLCELDMQKFFIEKQLKTILSEYHAYKKSIFLPMGLHHPMHILASNLRIFTGSEDIHIYQDTPYSFQNRFGFLIPYIVEEYRLQLLHESGVDDILKKMNIFEEAYSFDMLAKEPADGFQEKIYKKGK